jgi:hypothetical protein
MVNKAAAALGRKGGKAGRGAAKRRGGANHYSALGSASASSRWADGKKRRRSCVVCGRRVLATSREFDAVGRTCEEHRKG